MIIKGKNSGGSEKPQNQNAKTGGRKKILKASEVKLKSELELQAAPVLENQAETLDEKKALETAPEIKKQETSAPEIVNEPPKEPEKTPEKQKTELELALEEFDGMDVSMPEFKERYERRRGERRRGFRRIDERALVSRAQEEARNIREIAAREGYKSGLLEAQNDIEAVKTSLEEFVGARHSAFEELSDDILEIAVEVAKKIIKKEVELSNDVLKSVMSEVFLELGATDEKVTVKVNPEDVDFAKASLPEILADSPIDAKVIVTGDELIEKGSCTVIASNGVVDANFSTQLAIIQNAFGIYKGGE